MTSDLTLFLIEVEQEIRRAQAKFPGDNLTMIALMEEVGELAKAAIEESPARVRREAVQVACMAARMALEGDASTTPYRASQGLPPAVPARAYGPYGDEHPIAGEDPMTAAMTFFRPTSNGIAFDLANPTPEIVDPDDIAWQLSMINRWCGNLRTPYSVAQHSVLVARAIDVPAWRIYGLLHDAGEAYTGDLITPLKSMIQLGGFDIVGVEHRIFTAVLQRLGLAPMTAEIAEAVHVADRRVLATEYRDVVRSRMSVWTPAEAPFAETVAPIGQDAAYALFLAELGVHLQAAGA